MSGKANNRSDHESNHESKQKIIIERTYKASIEDVWQLWTTKEGIESWWGPEGFSVKVHDLDLRAGGQMVYAMTAVDPPQVQFMKQAGMPLTTEARLTYTDIVSGKTIAYTHRADFIPGVEPYTVGNKVDFFAAGGNVRMVLTLDPMHSDEWTQRAVMGMESQLGKLARVIAGRGGK
jgi:uncharacterized protein YndB with AHSA1/START domain